MVALRTAKASEAKRQEAEPTFFWKNLLTLLLSVLTGAGHVYRRSYVKGALLLSVFLVAANGWFLGRVLLSRPELAAWLLWACPFLTVTIWVFGVIDAYRIGFRLNRSRFKRRRRELLQRSLRAYLTNQLEEARRVLLRAIKYDHDWDEPSLLVHLGVLELRLYEQLKAEGDRRGANLKFKAARRAFSQYLSRNPKGPWRKDICQECEKCDLKLPWGL